MSSNDRTAPSSSLPSADAKPGASKRRLKHAGPKLQALEQRMMFDGAAVADLVAAGSAAASSAGAAAAAAALAGDHAGGEPAGGDAHEVGAPASHRTEVEASAAVAMALAPAATPAAREIVFIDASVPNALALAGNVQPGAEVVLLDGTRDGLQQIDAALQGRSDLDAIHIISHAGAGQMQLGSTLLDGAALQGASALLGSIGSHLGAEGDILIYGCDVGRGEIGANFIGLLAKSTQADVAASTNATGPSTLGGDWVLEAHSGTVEARALQFSDTAEPFLLGTPSVTSVDDTTYTEGQGAMVVDNNITITSGGSYDGKYVRFSLTNGQTTDILGLNSASNVNAAGAISLSGSSVYLGNGSTREVIGTIDSVENGTAGKALKINFVSTFNNSGFETGTLAGWTAMNQVINLGTTSIAGFTSPTDGGYPSNSGGNDNDYPSTPGTFTSTVGTTDKTEGSFSLRLLSSGMTTANGYDIVHGPAIYSDTFAASTGDKIYFDWRALAGSDAYDVFGYILNTNTGATTAVLDATGTSTAGTTPWATASATIPTNGTYRFVFVSGTYDFSGGKAAGASLYIDNVRVYGNKVNDAVVTSIARQVTFEATSDNPVTSSTRVFTVQAVEASGLSGSDTGLIAINPTNDAPTLTGTAQTISYTENANPTVIDAAVVVADPDGNTHFNGGWLQAQVTGNSAGEDRLSVISTGTGAGQISVSGSNISYGGTVIGTLDSSYSGVGSAGLRINLNASASIAATQALARAIGYANTSDAPSTAARTVTFTLNDGGNTGSGGALQGTRTATVNITAVDDPAVLTLSRGAATYIENDGSFFVDASLSLSDVDTTTMNGAKVTIGAGFIAAQDRLSPASGSNADGISYSYDAAKGVLTLSGSATIAQYQAALRAVKYSNTSDDPDTTARTINITLGNAVSLTIGGVNHYYQVITAASSWTAAKTAAQGMTFQGLTGYLATLTSQAENDFVREKLSADAWIGASDDYLYINAATGTTTYANQAAAEGHWYWVTGPEAGTRISDGNGTPVTYSGSFAYWNSGEPNNSGSNENYGEIFSTGVAPGRWNDLPNSSSLAYVVEYSDAAGTTPSFSKSLTITPQRVNDAPVTSGTVSMAGINEDATTHSGALVSSFLTSTDVDSGAFTGIAITGLSSSRGTWQYSVDNGAVWTNVGSVSDAGALLLRSSDRVRFVPDTLNADSASITYRAWDRSDQNSTNAPGAKVSVATNGGTTAYSTGTQTASISVSAVNDAPVLTAAAPTLTSISEDTSAPAGSFVSAVLGSSVTDVDTGAVQGLALTQLASGNGTWEYSINGGSSWAAVGTVSQGSALLLRATDKIRFRPDGSNATTASFGFKAWDTTSGSAGSKVDASVAGGTTAFSIASDSASITVTGVNDAPVLSASSLTLAPINEDDTSNIGQTVASLLGSSLTDVDNGAVQGVAITGSTAAAGSGAWQFSLDGGSTWSALGSVSGASAMLLRASDRVRFLPDTLNGGTASLTLRGWDQTSGTAGSTADTSSNGGSTAFSTTTATAGLVITSIDDAPVFTTGAGNATFIENAGTPVSVGSGLVLQEDSGTLLRASVRISAGFTAGDTLAVGTLGGLSASYNAATGVLTLSGNASAATYQTALRSVTFTTASDDPTQLSATRSLAWTATDAANNTSSASSSQITVTPLTDAPVLGGLPATWSYVEDDGTRVIAPTLTLADADDIQMAGATVVLSGPGYLNDGYETLSATTTGTSITAVYDGSTGTLTLSGTDSTANYQRVLRSVTYANTRDYNNPSAIPSNDFVLDGSTNARSVNFNAVDANSDGAGTGTSSTTTVTVTLVDANEVPQVSNVTGHVTHINYTEGGAPATLEGAVVAADDGLVSSITSAFVRVTAGLADGDVLSLASIPAGWTLAGSATQGTLTRNANGTDVISFSWDAATGDFAISTTSGSANAADYTAVMQAVGFSSNSDDPTASSGSRTLIWRVTDSGGLQSAVTANESTIIDITAINDTATVGGLPANGDIVFTEDGNDVTVAPLVTLADADDSTLASATVVLGGSGFVAGSEYLSLPGASVTAGSDWTLSNVGGTGIDAAYNHANGTLTLSNTASLADYQAVMRQVRYGSVDNNPTGTATTRSLTFTLTDSFGSRLTDADGGGNNTASGSAGAPATSTITLAPANDRPALSGLGGTLGYTEGGSAAFVAGSVSISDVDDTNLTAATVWISNGFTAGDTLAVATPGGLTVSFDSATGILTLSGTASKATYETALRSISFSSTSDDPTVVASGRTVSWQITDANASGDGALSSAVGSSVITITAIDDAATVAGLPAGGAISFTENGSAVVAAPALTLADPDDTQLTGASVAISSGLTTGDLLAVGADLTGTGISASYASGTLTLSGAASLADYQRVLRSIVFSNTGDDPAAVSASRTLTWSTTSAFASRLTDAAGGNDGSTGVTAIAGTSTLGVVARNDAPTISLVTVPAVYEQGSAPVYALRVDNTPGGVTLTDADVSDQIASASVVITDNRLSSDLLQVATPSGWTRSGNVYTLGGSSITVAYTAGTGTLAFSGTASRADYATLLGHVQFINSSNAPTASAASRTLVWTVTDSNGAGDGARSGTGSNQLVIRDRNDAPTVSPATQTFSYTEGAAGFSLAGFTVADPDPDEVLTATVTLSQPAAGSLNVPAGASYDAGTGVWTFTGSVTNVNAALAALVFTPGINNDVNTTISLQVADGGEDGATAATASIALNVTAVNDAPVLTPASPVLPALTEDQINNSGFSVASFRGAVSDVDTGALSGIALYDTSSGNGGWQYSLDGGSNWVNVGTVSGSQALLLRDSDLLRFVPNGQNATTASLGYRAWDRSSGAAGSKVDAGNTGSGSAFSVQSDTATLAVSAVNDAPVLSATAPALTGINEDSLSNAGQTVASVLGSSLSDVDAGAASGIAITASTSGAGHWQYSLDGGSNWAEVGAATTNAARLLRASDLLRFVPDGLNGGTATLSYRGWDTTSGTAGGLADASVNGGTTAFSSASDTATMAVAAVNDAPVLAAAAPQLASVGEDAVNNAGQSVASLVGSTISDVDTGALQGIALIDSNPGNGSWQYSLDAGSTWLALGSVSTGQALLLRSSDLVRFVPDTQNATTATLVYRAWDRSSGSAGTRADASVVGGTSAFSTDTNTATVQATAVNDAPVMAAASPMLPGLSEDDRNNAGQSVADLLGATVSDVDAGALQGIAVTGSSNGNGAWEYSLDNGNTWVGMGTLTPAQSLLLRATDRLRFVPDGQNATSATLDYRAWDRSSASAGDRADTTANGGSSAYSSASNRVAIAVTSVNDAPVLANAAPQLETLTEDATNNAGQTVASFIGSSISDVDSGAVAGIALTGTADGNGRWQYSLDGGRSWQTMGALSPDQSLLLRPEDRVRFVPDALNATTAALTYRAWDRSSGSAGDRVATTDNGGSRAFSTGENTASLRVTPVNDAAINDALPQVTGAARADGTLRQDAVISATPGLWHDVDTGAAAPTFSYQWQVADDAAGTNLRNLDGATAAQLALTSAQVGQFVRVRVVASDGVEPSQPAFSVFQRVSNLDPVASAALESPRATEAVPYSYTLPAAAFLDANGEDTLHFSATLADGSPLPDWLHFDAATRTFSGTPTGGDIGVLNLRVQADDLGGHPASATFSITVAGVPTAAPAQPVVVEAPAPAAPVTVAFAPVALPQPVGDSGGLATPDTFNAAGSVITSLSALVPVAAPVVVPPSDATRVGEEAAAPAATPGVAGTRSSSDFASGYTRSEGFQVVVPQVSSGEALLTVSKVPDAVLRSPAEPLRYTLAPDTFTHTRVDAVVNLTAARTDGSALPAWMQFDARTGTFTGTPPEGFNGEVEVLVTARDNFGNATTVLVKIRIGVDGKPDKLSLSRQLRQAASDLRPAERLKGLNALARLTPARRA